MLKITVAVENEAVMPFAAEHGLSLLIEYREKRILFDTGGVSGALLHNLPLLNISPETLSDVIISHGHDDHTGMLANFNDANIFYAAGAECIRFSLHQGKPPHNISMPAAAAELLNTPRARKITGFTEIYPGFHLTGAIPRFSSEDCGGPFFHDINGKTADIIADEEALLLDCGVLIQGCCHAGLINTVEYCRKKRPDIKIHTVIGGLHLLHADAKRLKDTAEYIRCSGIKQLYPMHCTGSGAIEFLQKKLTNIEIFLLHTGDTICLPQ